MSQLILIWSLCGLKTLQNVGDFPMYPIFSFKWFDSSQNASNFDFRCVWCLNPFESKFWCTHLSWSHQGSNYLLHTKSFDERPFETISKLSVSEFWRNYVADEVFERSAWAQKLIAGWPKKQKCVMNLKRFPMSWSALLKFHWVQEEGPNSFPSLSDLEPMDLVPFKHGWLFDKSMRLVAFDVNAWI